MANFNQTQIWPPVNEPITTQNGMLSTWWLNYFNQFYQIISTTLQYGLPPPSITTAERDANSQYQSGQTILNTDNNELQFYFNGAWQKITYTAAP